MRARIDWKYALGLELTDPGFHFSVLTEFRARLVAGNAEHLLLDRMLERFKTRGLVKARGKQRTDSTHVLAAVHDLHLLELVGETLRATLDDLAAVVPDWLRAVAPPAWFERYARRIEEYRLPKSREEREALALEIGADGFLLLAPLDAPATPAEARTVPMVRTLREVWRVHYARGDDGQLRWRKIEELPPVAERMQSPHDPEAHFSMKRQLGWVGYKVHVTETCDDDAAHLITHVTTCPAMQPDMTSTAGIHERLAAKGLLPAEHFVDSAYVDAGLLASSQRDYGVSLEGPVRGTSSRPARDGQGYDLPHFAIDWDARAGHLPAGQDIGVLAHDPRIADGETRICAQFSRTDCKPCAARALCTPATSSPSRRSFPSARGIRGAERGAGADERSRMAGALPQAGRGGGHALAGRACLRDAPEPLHRAGQDRASAGLHRGRDERLTGGPLAGWATARQDTGDPLRRPGSRRLNSPTVSDVSQGARALVLFVSCHRPEREPGRRTVQRAPGHGCRPGVLSVRKGGDRHHAGPGHDGRPRQLPPSDPHRAGQARAAPMQSLSEQQAGTGPPRHQRPLPAHAGLQMPPISRPVLPGPRRTPQLPPLSLPPQPVRSRRLPADSNSSAAP